MAEKKNPAKTQTKAGLSGNINSEAPSEKEKAEPKGKIKNSPKMSKEEAENRNDDKPLH